MFLLKSIFLIKFMQGWKKILHTKLLHVVLLHVVLV